MPFNIAAVWSKPLRLDLDESGTVYECSDLDCVPEEGGVYVFYREHGATVTPLYVGRTENLRRRLKQQLNSVKLMKALYEAQSGGRFVICCQPSLKRGQPLKSVLKVIEDALIDHLMAEGHELRQKQGLKRPNHQIAFTGTRAFRSFAPRFMRVRV